MKQVAHSPATPSYRDPETLQLGFVLLLMTVGFLSIAVSQICLGVNLAIFLFRWIFLKQRPPKTGLEKSVGLLAIWALITIPFSTDPLTSAIFYRRFYLFATIWIVASVITTERRRLLLLGALLLGALAVSLYGEIRLVMITGSLLGKRFSAMSNPMTSGSLLMMAMLLGTGFLLAGGQSRRIRLLVAAVLVPVLLGTLLTMTRSALLGLLSGLGVMLLFSHRRWFLAYTGTAVLGLVFLLMLGHTFLPENYQRRLSLDYQLSGTNTTARLEMWEGGWEMVKDRPVTGFGDRSLDTIAPDFYGDPNTVYHGHLHNNFVQMAVIWGIPGLLLGTYFLILPAGLLVRQWRRRHQLTAAGPVLNGWILGAMGVWAGFFLAGFTEWYFGDAETMLIYLAILGCTLGTSVSAPTLADEIPS